MTPLAIHPIWLVLVIVAGTTCFSLIILSFGLYVTSWREKREDSKKKKEADKNQQSGQQRIPDIMGRTQKIVRPTMPIDATKSQVEKFTEKHATFANEIPSEELDHVFGEEDDNRDDPDEDIDLEDEEVDLQDEELELQAYRVSSDHWFAMGATFEDLAKTTNLLRMDNLDRAEEKTVMDMAVRLAQTDLWEMIIQAIPQANEKIAKMLDSPLKAVPLSKPDDWKDFDIRDFI